MSTINSSSIPTDTSLSRNSLELLGTERLAGELRGHDAANGLADAGLGSLDGAQFDGAALVPTDAGEDVLNASAWSGVADGNRMLGGDTGFEASLGSLPLSQAADSAADAVFDALF